jgi:hypothetical protein
MTGLGLDGRGEKEKRGKGEIGVDMFLLCGNIETGAFRA